FPAIFVTAHDEHALTAFEVEAVDYVLKPVGAERLAAALERARQRIASRATPPRGRRLARASGSQPAGPLSRVLVREEGRIHVLPAESIDYVEAADDEVVLVADGRRHRKPERLRDLAAALDGERFVRIHRSTLLN